MHPREHTLRPHQRRRSNAELRAELRLPVQTEVSVPRPRSRDFDTLLAAIPHVARFEINGQLRERSIPQEDRTAQARLWLLEEDDIARAMADALITLNAESDGATREALLASGFSDVDIDLNFETARVQANGSFVRDIADDRDQEEPAHMVRARMAVAVGELLPSRQLIVSELSGRGFSKAQMDRFMRAAIDDAGKAFAGIGTTRLAEVA